MRPTINVQSVCWNNFLPFKLFNPPETVEHRNSLEVCTNMQSLSILFLNKYTDMSDEPLKFYNYPSEGARYQSNTLGRSRVLFATCLTRLLSHAGV